tara:strand:+ start:50 stop:1576 length:1527 start_codon:yes stop_codon:yes gene_type:complete
VRNKKSFFYFFLLFLLFKPLWLFNNQSLGNFGNDDLSYWLHVSSLINDFDLDYIDDYPTQKNIFNDSTNAPNHPPGSSILSVPIVFLFNFLDTGAIDRINPTGTFAYAGYFASNLLFILISFNLLKKIIQSRYSNKHSDLILFLAFVGTLVHYATTRFMMAHAAEFLLCSLLLYIFETKENPLSLLNTFNLTTIYFFLSITRPSTFIYSLCLLGVYVFKFTLDKKNIKFYSFFISFYSYLHYLTSMKLYESSNFFFNYSTILDQQNFSNEITFQFIISNFIKLPNLFFSFSMGIIWVCPIIFLGIISIFVNSKFLNSLNALSKSFLFLFFLGAFAVVIAWQGRDVSFGQRLLVGLIPFCTIRASELMKNIRNSKYYLYPFLFSSYLGYIYFYSSSLLTLRKGKTLWGNVVGYSGEDYFLYLFQNLLNIENILSVLSRNIAAVNFFHFVKFQNIEAYIKNIEFISSEKISALSEYANIYQETNLGYLLVINLLVILFCLMFTKLITIND